MTISDKAVLVTGANRGIGQALVQEALRRGATRVYAGTRQPLAHVDGRITPVALDVTSAAQIEAAVERVGSLDLLINNAGLGLYDDLSDPAALERQLAVNLLGTYGVTQAFLPLLTRSHGAIANVLSLAALAAGEEDIFPDPMLAPMAEGWRSGAAKALERENAALLQAESAAAWVQAASRRLPRWGP